VDGSDTARQRASWGGQGRWGRVPAECLDAIRAIVNIGNQLGDKRITVTAPFAMALFAVMATHADRRGRVEWSQECLACELDVSLRLVQGGVAVLQLAHVLTISPRLEGGRKAGNRYQLRAPSDPQPAAVSKPAPEASKKATDPQPAAPTDPQPAAVHKEQLLTEETLMAASVSSSSIAANGAGAEGSSFSSPSPPSRRPRAQGSGREARRLRTLAFSQTPKPMAKSVAVHQLIGRALEAGHLPALIEHVIEQGGISWTASGLEYALKHTGLRCAQDVVTAARITQKCDAPVVRKVGGEWFCSRHAQRAEREERQRTCCHDHVETRHGADGDWRVCLDCEKRRPIDPYDGEPFEAGRP
jgi:hypothetical protein